MIIYFVFVILYKFSNGIETRWMSVLLRWDYLMPNTNHTCHHTEVYDLTTPPCIITNRIWNILFTTLSQPPWIIIENLPPKFQNRFLHFLIILKPALLSNIYKSWGLKQRRIVYLSLNPRDYFTTQLVRESFTGL